jgi:hypothetical protein
MATIQIFIKSQPEFFLNLVLERVRHRNQHRSSHLQHDERARFKRELKRENNSYAPPRDQTKGRPRARSPRRPKQPHCASYS